MWPHARLQSLGSELMASAIGYFFHFFSKIMSFDLVLRNVGLEVLLAWWWHVFLAL